MRRLLIIVGCLSLFLVQPGTSPAAAQANQEPQFIPGELIVGYKTAQDRRAALDEFGASKGSLRSLSDRGSVEAQEAGSSALKLRFRFPESTTRSFRENRGSELSLLQDIAKSVREKDSRVKYAHPNWIMDIDPIETNSAPIEQQSFSVPQDLQGAPRATTMPNDPLFTMGLQWHFLPPPAGMNAVGAWKQLFSSSRVNVARRNKVVVAVLDTGLLFDHPDIAGSGHVVRGYNFVSWDGCDKEPVDRGPDATDTGNQCHSTEIASHWHGTHVAGIIGAAGTNNGLGIAGIAWDVTVLPVRVLGPGGGNTSDIADAIRWAAGLDVFGVPRNKTPADIINMSLGGRFPCTEDNFGELISAIADARAAGAVVVVSAGNGAYVGSDDKACKPAPDKPDCKHVSEDFRKYEPASCPGVISVAASDNNGFLAYYSNYGDVTIMAPGGDARKTRIFNAFGEPKQLSLGVWSTIKGQYGAMQGTSQAAPHVSGAIALALIAHPQWRGKPDLIERKLRATAVQPPLGACPLTTPCGAGQLDAAALVAAP